MSGPAHNIFTNVTRADLFKYDLDPAVALFLSAVLGRDQGFRLAIGGRQQGGPGRAHFQQERAYRIQPPLRQGLVIVIRARHIRMAGYVHAW